MKRIVVDSSVIVKWFIPEDYSEYAAKLRDDHLMGRVEAVAPIYALLEVYNALRKYYVRGLIDREVLHKVLSLLHEIGISYAEIDRRLLDNAIEYSIENHVTVYDAYYIVLAHDLDTVFYTADDKLLKRLEKREQRVKHIREYLINESRR